MIDGERGVVWFTHSITFVQIQVSAARESVFNSIKFHSFIHLYIVPNLVENIARTASNLWFSNRQQRDELFNSRVVSCPSYPPSISEFSCINNEILHITKCRIIESNHEMMAKEERHNNSIEEWNNTRSNNQVVVTIVAVAHLLSDCAFVLICCLSRVLYLSTFNMYDACTGHTVYAVFDISWLESRFSPSLNLTEL